MPKKRGSTTIKTTPVAEKKTKTRAKKYTEDEYMAFGSQRYNEGHIDGQNDEISIRRKRLAGASFVVRKLANFVESRIG